MSEPAKPEKTLKQKVDDLAHKIADTLLDDKEPPRHLVDNFRVLTQYVAVDHKMKGPEDDDGQGDDFGKFRDRIRSA